MPSKKYGVWATNPTSYTAQTPKQDPKSPHITLSFPGGSAAINVKSTSKDTRLVYWVNKNFSHPITSALSQLPLGLKENPPQSESLDFQRTKPPLVDLSAGTILPSFEEGPNNDILDKLEPILTQAINEKATIYLFGEFYHDKDGSSGIHDVHMNQGNAGSYGNDIWSDGSFLVKFGDGHWEGVFLAFADQALPTNGEGKPEKGAEAFDQKLGSGRK